jgi:2-amino-4-hydroxy-6-hydroxymethyldihydropteridine diphosphokinase
VGQILKKSSIYETAPWGKSSPHSYLNQALELETFLSPSSLLEKVLHIEAKMGRVRMEKWGDRIIDIDILLYDQEIIETEDLKIPHPEMGKRRFVLLPLVEIAPHWIHPIFKTNMENLLKACQDKGQVEKLRIP